MKGEDQISSALPERNKAFDAIENLFPPIKQAYEKEKLVTKTSQDVSCEKLVRSKSNKLDKHDETQVLHLNTSIHKLIMSI